MEFRTLRADEIDCRIKVVKETGVSLLLYKDARVDQNILDETVGCMNWQRHHSRDNANCIVSIWDESKKQWIEKEDTGTESNTEAEKGLASDSFKRACFNWGIGRELYSAPFIWISNGDCNIKNGKCYDKFVVKEIDYDEKNNIISLVITDEKGKKVYSYGAKANDDIMKQILKEMDRTGIDEETICKRYKVEKLGSLNEASAKSVLRSLKASKDKES